MEIFHGTEKKNIVIFRWAKGEFEINSLIYYVDQRNAKPNKRH